MDTGDDLLLPTNCMDGAYQSFLPRIGLLSKEEVSKVMYAYLSLQTHHAKAFLIGVPIGTSLGYVKVPAQNVKILADMQEKMLEPIDQAIKALEGATHGHEVTPPCPTPKALKKPAENMEISGCFSLTKSAGLDTIPPLFTNVSGLLGNPLVALVNYLFLKVVIVLH